MKKNDVQVWINDAQAALLHAQRSPAIYFFNVWSRGTGKSGGIGLLHYERLRVLPRAKFFLIAPTYKLILNNCLASMIKFWESLGLKEYDWKNKSGHYVVGRTPPTHFEKPFNPPRQYEHVITFWTGYTIEMLSMDRPDLLRGGSFDGGDADEVALLNKEHLFKNLLPTIRGNAEKYGDNHPFHGKFSGFTSMPWLARGQWVLDYETIQHEDPLFHYSEATAECNVYALGKDWIRNQRAVLTPEIFNVEIMNERIKRAQGGFYHKFDDVKHVYSPGISYVDDPGGRGVLVDRYTDHNPDQLIDLSFDFGGWFSGALLFQQSHSAKGTAAGVVERLIDSFYVLKDEAAEDLVDQLLQKYTNQKVKYVRLYGEPRGHDPSAHGKTLYEKVADRFRTNGWIVEIKVTNSPAHSHDRRYAFINDILEESKQLPRLRINEDNCKSPIISLKLAEKTHDLKKDKSLEKDRTFDQRRATHFSDALDYFFMQKYYKANCQSTGKEVWF